ncbi:MAG: HD domain-containing protein [Treponema sp.]|jgi:putative nucleotidyltransferase with HDIG domain|nr:HD domain-containing protein [Treponema sp.]
MGNAGIYPILKEVAGIFNRNGKQVFLVGGAVRDILRGKKAHDWDLATDARPEEVISLFKKVIPTGIKHGTVTILYKGNSLETTTFRTESDYTDGRRPGRVEYATAIEEDLSRRDFTMNAMAQELPGGRLVDPFGGAEDIRRGIIRCVGQAGERFNEDGLRPLRALRFAAQLGFVVDGAALAAITGALGTTAKVSPERVRDELDKILVSPRPSSAFLPMEKTGLLTLLLPDLAACRGIEQKGYHRFDVLDHSLLACDYAAAKGFPLRVTLAALFHDIGKPRTRKLNGGVWTFYNHEKESARLAGNIMRAYRYPGAVTGAVVHLVEEHMFFYDDTWTDAAVRRFVIRAGEENLEDLYALRHADAFGTAGIAPSPVLLLPLMNRVEAVLAQSRAFSLKDLAVSGRDLMALGVKPGPRLGIVLKELLEAVLDDPALNTKEKLLEIAANYAEAFKGGESPSG